LATLALLFGVAARTPARRFHLVFAGAVFAMTLRWIGTE